MSSLLESVRVVKDPEPIQTEREATDLCPAAVQARIAARARELAHTTGGFAAPYAVAGYREAYLALWARYTAECPDKAFWPARI
jgi:hypothetical protein